MFLYVTIYSFFIIKFNLNMLLHNCDNLKWRILTTKPQTPNPNKAPPRTSLQ